MVEKTNKSTTILLLVVAGALLFLVGSFTGQITFSKGKALTTQQKQEVLNMLRDKCYVTGMSYLAGNPDKNCNDLCDNHKDTCISGSFEEAGNINGQRVTYYSGDLPSCSYNMYPPNFGGQLIYSCMCCNFNN